MNNNKKIEDSPGNQEGPVELMKLKKAKAVTTIRNKAQKPETFMI
jgi:hypothetical protein